MPDLIPVNNVLVRKKRAKKDLDRVFKAPFLRKFRPIVKTGTLNYNSSVGYGSFNKVSSQLQSLGFNPLVDRYQRYSEYDASCYTAEILAAIDIYADYSTTKFITNDVIQINTEDGNMKTELENLYFNTLNLNNSLWGWVRDMLKYGDNFLLLDLQVDVGVGGILPLSVYEVERVEDVLDTENPIKFIMANSQNIEFSIWDMVHFRMLSEQSFRPYGYSIIEPVRRYWRSLTMLEDSLMIYRIVRSPERRVFYIDVAGLPAESVESYVKEVVSGMKNTPLDASNDNNLDFRLEPLSMLDDIVIPVRGKETGTRIDVLKSNTWENSLEDIRYIQRKLVTAMKIPARYLGLDQENKSDLKNAAAQEDIAFSRVIERIQSMVVIELKKIGIIHLILKGYDPDEADRFDIAMKNPSSASEMEKLEVVKEKFGIASDILDSKLADTDWVYQNILNFTRDEVQLLQEGLKTDFDFMAKLKAKSDVLLKKYTQEYQKKYNIELPADGMAMGAGGQQNQEEPKDVQKEYKSTSLGGDSSVTHRLQAKGGSGSSVILKPFESKDAFIEKRKKNSTLLNEDVSNSLLKMIRQNEKTVSEIHSI